MTTPALSDARLRQALAPLIEALTASGFTPTDDPDEKMAWVHARGALDEAARAAPDEDPLAALDEDRPADVDRLVLWRHPRLLWQLHGHVMTSRSPHAVHLRFLDPDWAPQRVLPGYLEKGFVFEDEASLEAQVARLTRVIWPRALAWFEAPVSAHEMMLARGRVLSVVAPGPMLERHRARADWLASRGRVEEAEHVRGVVATLDAAFAAAAARRAALAAEVEGPAEAGGAGGGADER